MHRGFREELPNRRLFQKLLRVCLLSLILNPDQTVVFRRNFQALRSKLGVELTRAPPVRTLNVKYVMETRNKGQEPQSKIYMRSESQ